MIPSEIYRLKNVNIEFRAFKLSDTQNLVNYLNSLSNESKKRFGPHPFTPEAIQQLYFDTNYHLFVAIECHTTFIVAYFIIKNGWFDFETGRYQSYGLNSEPFDCTIAPSVAEFWQGKGLGSIFFRYTRKYLFLQDSINRFFLWGGVQSSNKRALKFYKKNGFKVLGHFEHNGDNTDMMLKT